MNEITVYLSEDEARQFRHFQQHRRLFEVLEEERVFDKKVSSFEVHLDIDGKVRVINLHHTVRM